METEMEELRRVYEVEPDLWFDKAPKERFLKQQNAKVAVQGAGMPKKLGADSSATPGKRNAAEQ